MSALFPIWHANQSRFCACLTLVARDWSHQQFAGLSIPILQDSCAIALNVSEIVKAAYLLIDSLAENIRLLLAFVIDRATVRGKMADFQFSQVGPGGIGGTNWPVFRHIISVLLPKSIDQHLFFFRRSNDEQDHDHQAADTNQPVGRQ